MSNSSDKIKITKTFEDGYEQVMVSHMSESPDPRVGGTKIIFDARLDKITEQSQTSQLDAYIKVKTEIK
jgi:hypothetical protein